MATAYEIAFQYEIANECIAGINGFISRNYNSVDKKMPKEIEEIDKEIWDIYRKLPLENDMDKMLEYRDRLKYLLKHVKEITPQPHL